jgi:DNA-binding MarR family transcriptional regulator
VELIMTSDTGKVTSISKKMDLKQANDGMVSIHEDRFREMLQEFSSDINNSLAGQVKRLNNSVNRMLKHYESVCTGEEEPVLHVTTDSENADLAVASMQMHLDLYYVYIAKQLAEHLNVRSYDVQQMIKALGMKGDRRYHWPMPVGKMTVHKYSSEALSRLKIALQTKEYVLPQAKK